MPRLFCFGLGFSALALARALKPRGWAIAGTTRGEEARAALTAEGIETDLFDRDRPLTDARAALTGTTHIVSSVPPDDRGDPVIDQHADDIAALDTQWIGYLSTTGVYGDRGGAWVDETSDLRPIGTRGRRRVEAEEAWLDLWRRHGRPVHLFRLAGIYGPGRGPFEQVRAGTARRVIKPGQVFSRIHVEDIVQVLEASMARPNPGAAYNVCDNEAAPPQDVILEASRILGVAPPPEIPFESANLSPMARSFYDELKRVSNRRIREELGVNLRYPTYREGLAALARS
ncbi:MAG: SDR family oxidoreductase [Alphaproteobacteria bacterium]|nr:SDR family oxidoreductase [Alphaproteobacteria bacterium]